MLRQSSRSWQTMQARKETRTLEITMQAEIAGRAKFEQIRYAQCWEDADVLLEALDVRPSGTYLSIASAGDNTLALVGAGAKRVIAVDLSPAQIACLELRTAAYRRLSYLELLQLLGQKSANNRRELYRHCRADLSATSRQFWDQRPQQVDRGIAQGGKFERYLDAFRRFVLPLVHGREKVTHLFSLETEDERREFFDKHWNSRRWYFLCRLFFGRTSLGRLGRDPSFMLFADEPVWTSLQRRIPNALVAQRPADNPYLQRILCGRFATALPYSLRPENFEAIRDNLDALEWRCDSIENVLKELPVASLNGCNLSDIFEYMSFDGYENLLWRLVDAGAAGCRLVYWNVVTRRQRPRRLQTLLAAKRDLADRLHLEDKAFFYRDLVIEEVI
jgi:S-adenosylmethionine-diacylglycerol 3-amino-3-carboxypropyl transferase